MVGFFKDFFDGFFVKINRILYLFRFNRYLYEVYFLREIKDIFRELSLVFIFFLRMYKYLVIFFLEDINYVEKYCFKCFIFGRFFI